MYRCGIGTNEGARDTCKELIKPINLLVPRRIVVGKALINYKMNHLIRAS